MLIFAIKSNGSKHTGSGIKKKFIHPYGSRDKLYQIVSSLMRKVEASCGVGTELNVVEESLSALGRAENSLNRLAPRFESRKGVNFSKGLAFVQIH